MKHQISIRTSMLLCLIVMMYSSLSSQTTVTLSAVKDATIYSENGSGSNGAGALFAGTNNRGEFRRALVQFDLSEIPNDATITSASFTVNGNRQSGNVTIHRLTDDFGEGSTMGAGNGGGNPSNGQADDATWESNFLNSSAWGNAGGDFQEADSGTQNVSMNGSSIWSDMEVVADVQSWIDGSSMNYGWILIGDETTRGSSVRMNSRESNSSGPSLEITYDITSDCDVSGGDISGGPFAFTVGDGVADNIPAGSITVANAQGANSQWVVTDDEGYILGLPPMPSAVDFDGAGAGTCLIWHLSYDGDISGLEMGLNANSLEGCHALSNSIEVIRTLEGDCQANGGELFGGPFAFTVGDGVVDNIPAGSITVANAQGMNSRWIVTDDQGNILGLPPMPGVVNFDGAGAGTCLIWHLSYDGDISGLEVGMNANELEGCHSLSNSIEVIRTLEGDCQANGGELFGGPFAFTVGDGIADNIPAGSITVANAQGSNSQWVVTDDQGNILGLPPMPGVVNFDGAGAGTCLIWHLSYDGDISGLEVGMNANELEGCHALSNSIEVVRTLEGDCQANGGELFGGPFAFTVGDGVADNIPAGSITVANAQGANSQWIVTDDEGNILGLPPMPGVVNFDGAGAGTCLIWHLSYDGDISGLEVGMNANELEGCHALSNSIEVVRTEAQAEECSTPEGFNVRQRTKRSFVLSWDRVPNVARYELRLTIEGSSRVFLVRTRNTKVAVGTLLRRSIFAQVRTVCDDGSVSEFSDQVEFKADLSKSIRNETFTEDVDYVLDANLMNLTPNPASDFISIDFENGDKSSSLSIIDISGKTVFQEYLSPRSYTHRINLDHLQNGIYQVVIMSNGEILDQQRFIKVSR